MNAGKNRRRGGRQRSSAEPVRQEQDWMPAKRALKPAEVLSADEIENIHNRSLEVLRDIGIEFMLPEALDILEQEGARVDRETGIVKFDPEIVESWIKHAPPDFTIVPRNGERSLHFGGDDIVYGSIASTPNVMDLDNGRRPGNKKDFQNLVKLSHMIGSCGLMSGYPVEPIDLPANHRHLDCAYDFLTLTDKAFRLYAIGETRTKDTLEMIKIGLGLDQDQLKQSPRAFAVLNVNSPLRVDAPLLEGCMELTRNNQAVIVTPVAFSGAMSPITLSGSLIQHNAECLAAIAFLQMVKPGAPVFYGSIFTNIDMKTGAPAFGTPDSLVGMIATGQLARRYNIPQRVFNGSTSNAVDAQAAYESMFSLWAAYLCGSHLVLHAHGMMEAGLTTSYEKVLVDAEMIQMMNAMSRPIDLSDADEAVEAIRSVGAGGHFLGTPHTMSRYKTAFHEPLLSDWRPYEFWQKDGSQDTAKRANTKWKKMLNEYEKPAIDPAINEELHDFVKRRKHEIGTNEI